MKFTNILGWVGVAILQLVTLPAILQTLETGKASMPLLTMLGYFLALSLLLIQALAIKNRLYIFLNGSGFLQYLFLIGITI